MNSPLDDENRTVVLRSQSRRRAAASRLDSSLLADLETEIVSVSLWQTEADSALPGRKSPRTPEELVGQLLGGWRLAKLLGSGAMGAVYLAEKQWTRAALKILAPALSRIPDMRLRFLREGRIQQGMEHPSIVRVLETGQDGEIGYVAMELMPGGTLADLLRQRVRLPEEDATGLFLDLLDGLSHAHEKGYVHRDIKPDNVLLDAWGSGALGDFGLAGVLGHSRVSSGSAKDGATSDLTRTGAVVGTPAYMAPEQIAGGIVDQRSDLYSFGCLMYRTAAGRVPFAGHDLRTLLQKHLTEPPLPPSRVVALSEDLDAIILRLLEKDPARRFAVASEVRRVLEEGYLSDPVGGESNIRRYRHARGSELAPKRPARRHGSSWELARASASDRVPEKLSAPRRIPSGPAAVTAGSGMRWILLAVGLVAAGLAGYAILGSPEEAGGEVERPEPLSEETEDGEDVAGGTAPETDLDDLAAAIREGRHEDAERILSSLPSSPARDDVRAALEIWRRARELGLALALGGSIDLVAGAARERLEAGAAGGRLPLLRALAALYLDPALVAARPTAEAPDLERRFRAADLAMALGTATEPRSAEPFRLRGLMHLALGRPAQAAEDLVAALGFLDEERDKDARRDTSALAAIALTKAGEPGRALGILDAYKESKDRDVLAARAYAQFTKGDLASARRTIPAGVEKSTCAYLHHVLGRILYQEADREGAAVPLVRAAVLLVEGAREAESQDYEQPAIYFWAARVLHELGREAEAAEWRRSLERWNPAFEWEGRPAASYLE
ncbi:MAG: serine/threonine protein kinase [Planctomycetes bacterium]|nr:serine/threonine protein kinase [Planctomycetota bacterium]